MSEILEAYTYLASLLHENPTRQLAIAVAWLDPGRSRDRVEEYAEDPLIRAYYICHDCFPDAFVEMTTLLHQRKTRQELEAFALKAINDRIYPPMQNGDLEEVLWGLPIIGQGIAWYQDGTTDDVYPEILPFMEKYFGVEYDHKEDEDAYDLARRIALPLTASLSERESQVYQDLHHLIGWCFSCSGNTLVDYSDEEISEMGIESLSWTPEDIAFNRDMHEEAEEIIAGAHRALVWLETDLEISLALHRNIRALRRRMIKGDIKYGEHAGLARLCRWPHRPQDGSRGTADSDR